MRAVLIIILVSVVAVFLLAGGPKNPAAAAEVEESPAYTFTPTEERDGPFAAPETGSDGAEITVFLEGETVKMSLREYLIGTLAAEMPANFQAEALKAQAVAARTYALYRAGQGEADHPQAAVCGDAGCCAAYRSPEALAENWGEKFYVNLRAIETAVDATAGLCLTWQEGPILAVFHSSSGGETESCGAVWGQALPYLVSVESPETVEKTESSVQISWSDFLETVRSAYPEAQFGENRADWLSVTERTDSGRVAQLRLGGVPVSGMDFRFLFGLRSTDFQVLQQEDGLLFQVSGYGHGVGMSQYGAEAMAAEGADFTAILAHYYPGTQLEVLAISALLG